MQQKYEEATLIEHIVTELSQHIDVPQAGAIYRLALDTLRASAVTNGQCAE